MISVKILNDIQLRENGHIFTKNLSVIEYDSKRPRKNKTHLLIYQQGREYGTIGDCCEYLTHQELEMLSAAGYVQINHLRQRRRSGT